VLVDVLPDMPGLPWRYSLLLQRNQGALSALIVIFVSKLPRIVDIQPFESAQKATLTRAI
jgi:hypothetical protein